MQQKVHQYPRIKRRIYVTGPQTRWYALQGNQHFQTPPFSAEAGLKMVRFMAGSVKQILAVRQHTVVESARASQIQYCFEFTETQAAAFVDGQ